MKEENSECVAGFLHDFRFRRTVDNGVVEQCLKCKTVKFFHNKTPNYIYLSFHLRSALQRDHKRFNKEYAKR